MGAPLTDRPTDRAAPQPPPTRRRTEKKTTGKKLPLVSQLSSLGTIGGIGQWVGNRGGGLGGGGVWGVGEWGDDV